MSLTFHRSDTPTLQPSQRIAAESAQQTAFLMSARNQAISFWSNLSPTTKANKGFSNSACESFNSLWFAPRELSPASVPSTSCGRPWGTCTAGEGPRTGGEKSESDTKMKGALHT
eukprot:1150859-Pelagomonas_calceolata.AAC.4